MSDELEPNSDPDPDPRALGMILGACALGVMAILTLVNAGEWWEVVTGTVILVFAAMLLDKSVRVRFRRPTSSQDH